MKMLFLCETIDKYVFNMVIFIIYSFLKEG
jgi:hypothetical protein